MLTTYYLKCFDNTLLSFDIDTSFGMKITNINIKDFNKEIYPICLQENINEETIKHFINSRVIPKNRAFVEQILSSLNLSINDRKGIIDISKGLSLTDPYWIVTDDNLKFKDYNLYDNDFSEVLSLIAFTGYHSKIKELITSPELTTNGMLPKCWRRINEEIFLYKGSTKYLKSANTGFEPYSEYFASLLAEKMGINHVTYDLDKWKNEIVSTCKIFTSKEVSYIQIGDVVKNGGISECAKFMYKNGYYKDFANMILFDALIMNTDRHFGNFGLLKNNQTGEWISMAPLFDNGNSLLSLEMPADLENTTKFKEIITSQSKNISFYGISYDDLVKKFCLKSQIKTLNKLANFTFIEHSKYKLSEKRLENLSLMIRMRAKRFIEILELNQTEYHGE